MKKERVLVIFNPSSGLVSKDIAASIIFKRLRKHFETVSLINSNSPAHGQEIARKATENFDLITAFGGDGTINSIASILVGTDVTLGVLPGGSGNGLVRNLNIPVSWRKALDVLVEGENKLTDVGKLNETYFFNLAGVGLDGIIAKRFNQEGGPRGVLPYMYYTYKECFGMPPVKIRIRTEDEEFEDEVLLIEFANFKQYGGRFVIAPFADAWDGLLDIVLLKPFKFRQLLPHMIKISRGNIHKFPFFRSFRCRKIEVKLLDRAVPFHFDGEFGGEDKHDFSAEILPSKLRIRVPQTKE